MIDFNTEKEFSIRLREASRRGEPLQGTFSGDVDFVYVSLSPNEDVTTTLDGEFSTAELRAIVGYKDSTL